jgi:glyoxylase-like metal-dependent hydrolase (beta-lactamase superfamily II)
LVLGHWSFNVPGVLCVSVVNPKISDGFVDMATKITWLGHNAWSIETGGKSILVDPFLDDSPTAPVKAASVNADYILLSHGHGDHVGDTVSGSPRRA